MREPFIDDLVNVDHGNQPDVSFTLRALQADRRDVRVVAAPLGATIAAAANLGARHAIGRWLLFLEPDVVLQRGAVARMAAAGGSAPTPWIVGGRLTDTEGRERRAARGGALNTWSALAEAVNWPAPKPPRRRRRPDEGDAAPSSVAAVSGALMLIPRRDFQDLRGFDECFDGDYADLDLCRRAAEAGGSVLFQPDAAAVQFPRARAKSGQARSLALFAARSARTPLQRAFAAVAGPTLGLVVGLKDFVAGRPPVRR
jgi:GT2 family glycosyltransferase